MKPSYLILASLLVIALLVGGVSAQLKTTIIDGAYTVDIYTTVTGVAGNTTWTPPPGVGQVEYLVVGGGVASGITDIPAYDALPKGVKV